MHQLKEVIDCYDATAEKYAGTFYRELERKPLDRLLLKRFADENKDRGRIADLGCGSGQTTVFLRNSGVEDLVGIDLSPEMVKVASGLNGSVDFEVGNMLGLDYPDETFGAALAFYAIVHFNYEEIEKAFREIRRVLKNSGRFLFSFHVGEGGAELDEFLDRPVRITFYFFEVDRILELLESVGFKVLETIIRYPYRDVEHPSRRAYVLAEK
ncbi:MAG: class I SAM-dependent methyltransferase [Pyrinomonadaceae bacterium]